MGGSVPSSVARLASAVVVLVAGLAVPPAPAFAAAGPCGERQSLPGPGHYSGGFQALLVRSFTETATQLSVPIGGPLELDIDDAGHVTGSANMAVLDSPDIRALPITATFSLTAPIDGQLPDPLDGADVVGQATIKAAAGGSFGNKLISWNGFTNLHLRDFQPNLCAAIQGTWLLEGSNDDEAGHWDVQDAQWAAKLAGFDEQLEQEVRLTVGQLVSLPPAEALGLSPSLSPSEADGLLDSLARGAASLPSDGLFALYEKVRTSAAPPAQLRCLTDLVQTAIAAKLQEYLAMGGGPTYEEAARVGYGLRIGQGIGSGPSCPAFAAGLGALGQIIEASLNEAMAAGSDLERVARLTREARLYEFEALAKRGADWLQQRGYPL